MIPTVSRYGTVSSTLGFVTTPTAALFIALQLTAPGISPKTVRQAESVAGFILARAGVAVSWSGGCAIQVQITNSTLHTRSVDSLGFAILAPGDTGYAAISYPAVEREALSQQSDPANLLGAAIAHEVGHLLLGPVHTNTGIMRARFRSREIQLAGRGELLFNGDQSAKIREKIGERLRDKLRSNSQCSHE
jgi:hypothetical protein